MDGKTGAAMGISIAAIAIAVASIGMSAMSGMAGPQSAPITHEIHLFSQIDESIDEDRFGVPPDLFSREYIVVNGGDRVDLTFYNLEPVETRERHTFTIDEYGIDLDINAGEMASASFVASEPGVYEFLCTYHLPTMSGHLIVL